MMRIILHKCFGTAKILGFCRWRIKMVPGSLEEALNALENNHEFLLQGDVFTQDVIDTWIDYKRTVEVESLKARPHPHEFYLYFDI